MSFVYWIHLPDHTDITKEGYVGVTSRTVQKRFREHCSAAKSEGKITHLCNAIKKFDKTIVVDTLLEGSDEYCYQIEQLLRPDKYIGWNIAQGGYKSYLKGIPREMHPCYQRNCSKETRDKIGKAVSGSNNGMSGRTGELNSFYGKTHSEDVLSKLRNKQISASHRDINKRRLLALNEWESPATVKETWIKAIEYYHQFVTGISYYKIAKKEGIPDSRLNTLFRKFNNGWNPLEDITYLGWLKTQKENL